MRSVDDITAAELLDGLPSRVHEVYAPFVRDIPDHPAFVEGGRSWSYRQFSEAVDAVAKDLSNLGIRPGDRVMIASENSVALGAMLFAASKLAAWGICG
jgi:acyl-CoA synthetase (AMP-forming)/AMP-acid ligase II